MLDKYVTEQPNLCSLLSNAISNDKLSHAYILDSNGNMDALDIATAFAKEVVCYNIHDENEKKIICQRIDDGNFIDIKIIEPDGLWIKKEQLLELQEEFNKKSFEGSKKIYIIKGADKMNVQASNSILKFLEEPVDDIMAILIVDNVNLLLPTIVSRCQVMKLNKKDFNNNTRVNLDEMIRKTEYEYLSSEERDDIISSVLAFIDKLEKTGLDTIIYAKNLWHNKFKDRSLNILALDIMINFYYDVLKYLSGGQAEFFTDYTENITSIANLNDIMSIAKKIEIVDDAKNGVKRNLNVNLLVDKMIIGMCGD